MKEKVIVGMSGGVDSSVAALLLKEQGYDVIGVTMQLYDGGAARDAQKVAAVLEIPFYTVDFQKEFRCKVMDYFVEEYLAGRTPNPCIVCNRHIKWEALINYGKELGADYIATGHYAGIEKLPSGRFAVCRSVTAKKDQTYALYGLTQEQLSHTLMPVGAYAKEEIREMAMKNNLPTAHKPDSQDICFVPDGDYAGFIERQAKGRVPGPGNFVTAAGTVLGQHKGITHYTIGQRRGLGLAMGHHVFVSAIRPETNEVVIGEAEDVFKEELTCSHLNYMSIPRLQGSARVFAKIRYAHAGEWCIIEQTGEDTLSCHFEKPVRAVTPGQAAVFYDGKYILGGGIING